MKVFRPWHGVVGDGPDDVVRSGAAELLIRGGKRSSKSVTASALFGARVTGQPIIATDGSVIPNPWPSPSKDHPRRYWIIGWDTKHIGQTIHRLLFQPGQGGTFRVIEDEKTGVWRTFNRANPSDAKRIKQSKLSEPVIPERFLDGGYQNAFEWEDKKASQFNCCHLNNGAEIYAYPSSARNPKQGDAVSGIWIDEDIQFPGHLKEWQDRLTDEEGWFMWSVWPHMKNEALLDLINRAEMDELEKEPQIQCFQLIMTDNPFLTDKGKKQSLGRMDTAEEVARRNRGELLTDALSMYQFSHQLHLIRRPQKGRRDLIPLTKAHKHLQDVWLASNSLPKNWTRYLSIDPSNVRTAVLSWVVPPPIHNNVNLGQVAICEWELIARRFSADLLAKTCAELMGSNRYEAFIMDMHAGRQTHAGREDNTHQLYAEAFRKHKILSRTTSYSFIAGCDVLPTRFAAVRHMLEPQMDSNIPQLMFIEERCLETKTEFAKYRKKTENRGEGMDSVIDTPNNPRLFDCMQSMEYFCAHIEPLFLIGQGYVDPSKYTSTGSPAYQRAQRILQRQRSGSESSVYLGSGNGLDSHSPLSGLY